MSKEMEGIEAALNDRDRERVLTCMTGRVAFERDCIMTLKMR